MQTTQHDNLVALDQASLFHPVTSIADHLRDGPTIYTTAEDVRIRDSEGHDYIDMGAGLWCVNVGYGRHELADAASTAMRQLSFQHLFGSASCEATIRLSERLLGLFQQHVPSADMARVFYGTSGSDANDTALKMVRYYNNVRGLPAKKKIIARIGAYHGLTFASGSLTGIAAYHKGFDQPIEGVLHTSCPHHFGFSYAGECEAVYTARLIADLEALIAKEGGDTIAAFIAEPVMGTGGVLLPPVGYFEQLQAVLDKHDILLIVDEVITGFGRTGNWFGSSAYNLRPDIVSLAKGLTSAYFPMSASIVSQRVWQVLSEASPEMGTFMHGFTYSGHPVGSAVALANLDLIEQDELVEKARQSGAYLLEALRSAVGDNPYVGDVRGLGLMVGVEFVADKASRKPFAAHCGPHRVVAKHAKAAGVLTRALPFAHVTSFSPPLTITPRDIDQAVQLYAKALQAAMPELDELSARS